MSQLSLWSFFKAPAPEAVRCSSAELAMFTRQLSVLFGSGVPLVQGLEAIGRGEDTLSVRIVPLVVRKVVQGHRLSTALDGFPGVFPPAYVSLVRGAEETGRLHSVLDHLAEWLERQDKLTRHVRKALTYPLFVLLTTLVLAAALLRTVIPGILEAVTGMGVALPAPTRALLGVVALVKSPWTWVLVAAGAVALIGYLRSEQGRRAAVNVLLSTPFVGTVLRYAATARLAMTLAMLLAAGVEVRRACSISSQASGLPPMIEDIGRVAARLREGDYLGEIYRHPLYPSLLSDMIRAGEETGRLSAMLRHAARVFEEETSLRLQSFTDLLEPIVLSGISLAVAFVILAVMMPMSGMLGAL